MEQSYPVAVSLMVFHDNELIFTSNGKWLYPLFDFEDFLKTHAFDVNRIYLNDKVIGKAAAMLIVRMGIQKVHGELMSEFGMKVFENFSIHYSFTTLVPRISCKTEELLLNIDEPEAAYLILCKRADRC